MSSGSGLPEALPKLTSMPRGSRQSSESRKVALPTESYTTDTPRPAVSSRTRSAKFSRAVHDHFVATVAARELDLLVRADGADHARAERVQPLARDQPHAARGRMQQHGLPALHGEGAVDQKLRRHALQECGGGDFVADLVGQGDQAIGGDGARVGVGGRCAGAHVRDALTDANGGHAFAQLSRPRRPPPSRARRAAARGTAQLRW